MRIGVIARRLQGSRFGIGRYTEYVLKYWNELLAPGERVVLYTQAPVTLPFATDETVTIRPIGPRLTGALWENLVLPRVQREVDVLFGPSYTLPLTYRGPSVVATHSVNEVDPGSHPWWYKASYTPWYRLSAKLATRVVVPSLSTKADVEAYYRIPDDRIDVVPEGVDDAFRPLDDEERNRATRRRFLGDDVPYVLFVGKMSRRRNIPTLIQAFASLKRSHGIPHKLLLLGRNVLGLPLERLAAECGVADSVVQRDVTFSSHDEVVSVYNAAALYAYPSTYDGFSLTVPEAMACGVPVVTMNRAALKEIAGGCALMLDELTVDGLAGAMHRVLTDPHLRADLRASGLERARTLHWRECARGTLDVLRRVAARTDSVSRR